MVFSSYEFIFLFLPFVLIGFHILGKTQSPIPQRLFLVLCSLFFYGYFNWAYLIIILASIAVNYILTSGMRRYEKLSRPLFIVGIIFNIGLLGYFKYADFFISNVNALFDSRYDMLHILLPLGISFFTFQQLSFLFSVNNGTENADTFLNYCLFVTFFPQLVAGPIVTYGEMMPQFRAERGRKLDANNITAGIYIFVIGLFKKVVIADTLALFVDHGFDISANLGLAAAWSASLSYTFQIYFDFSGYSDMALGLGRMLNINLPKNFNSPYKSEGMSEFWRRWHMTLGRALSTFVYIPLGGNRRSKPRTYINLFITFLISGIWHGAAWTFVAWGALHGLFVILDRMTAKHLTNIPGWLKTAVTFLIVNFLWVLFRAPGFRVAIDVYRAMLDFGNVNLSQLADLTLDGIVNLPTPVSIVYVCGLIVLLSIVAFKAKNAAEMLNSFSPSVNRLVFSALLFVISVIHISRLSVFIYFNF